MRYFRFFQSVCNEEWMEPEGFSIVETDGTLWFYLPLPSREMAEEWAIRHGAGSYEEVELNEYVDWGVQWSEHTPDFKEYALEIDLSKCTPLKRHFPSLRLKAGPGFGDLSHPTTRLTLAMMAPHVFDQEVIDMGCGSGILSLAASLLGARRVIRIHAHLQNCAAKWFTSGVLASETELYFEEALQRGWRLVEQKKEGDWMGFQWATVSQ